MDVVGPVAELVPITLFRQDGTFLTIDRQPYRRDVVGLAVAFRLTGLDVEGMSDPEREHAIGRFTAAMGLLDPHIRLYQYIVKTKTAPFTAPTCANLVAQQAQNDRAAFLNAPERQMYDIALYMVLVNEEVTPKPNTGLSDAFAPEQVVRLGRERLERAGRRLNEVALQFAVYLRSFGIERLEKDDTFRLLRRLVNYTDAGVRLADEDRLRFTLSDEDIDQRQEREGLLIVGKKPVRVRTMKVPPARTHAAMLAKLLSIPGEMIACLEWRRHSNEGLRAGIQRLINWNEQLKYGGVVAYLFGEKGKNRRVDKTKTATVKQLDNQLVEVEIKGTYGGDCSLTFVFHGSEAEQAAAEAGQMLAAFDASFYEETYNLINAWPAIMPGNRKRNYRYQRLMSQHVADLSFLFTVSQGPQHASRQPIAVFETPHRVPYRLQLWHKDVGHAFVVGPTGAGKSHVLNHVGAMIQQYDPALTVFFDMDFGYWRLCEHFGGSYFRFGMDTGVPINPFAGNPTPEHLYFLLEFVKVLMGGTLTERDKSEVHKAILRVYAQERSDRRMSTLRASLPPALRPALAKWVEGGRFGRIFDHETDALDMSPFTVFDFGALKDFPELVGAVQFYCLNRVRARMTLTNGLTACFIDEAGQLMQDATMRAYVELALVQWRKQNGIMVLATQHTGQFLDSTARVIVESCPTKILLPNPAAQAKQYADLFDLNPVELDLVRTAQEQRQVVVKPLQAGARVLTLNVDPQTAWLYSNAYHDRFAIAAKELAGEPV